MAKSLAQAGQCQVRVALRLLRLPLRQHLEVRRLARRSTRTEVEVTSECLLGYRTPFTKRELSTSQNDLDKAPAYEEEAVELIIQLCNRLQRRVLLHLLRLYHCQRPSLDEATSSRVDHQHIQCSKAWKLRRNMAEESEEVIESLGKSHRGTLLERAEREEQWQGTRIEMKSGDLDIIVAVGIKGVTMALRLCNSGTMTDRHEETSLQIVDDRRCLRPWSETCGGRLAWTSSEEQNRIEEIWMLGMGIGGLAWREGTTGIAGMAEGTGGREDVEEKKVTLTASGQGGLAEWMGLEAFTWMDLHEWRAGSIDVMNVAR